MQPTSRDVPVRRQYKFPSCAAYLISHSPPLSPPLGEFLCTYPCIPHPPFRPLSSPLFDEPYDMKIENTPVPLLGIPEIDDTFLIQKKLVSYRRMKIISISINARPFLSSYVSSAWHPPFSPFLFLPMLYMDMQAHAQKHSINLFLCAKGLSGNLV